MTNSQTPISVVQYGLGPIGAAVARLVHERPHLRLIGGIDTDPGLVGRDLGQVIGLDVPLGTIVSNDAVAALAELSPDAVTLCTTSFLDLAAEQIRNCLNAQVNVVTTCEEILAPTPNNEPLWRRLDAAAREAGLTVLGTGVNPGFVMDSLPLFLTAACEHIDSITIGRFLDPSARRLGLQAKAGVGLDPGRFQELASNGRFGHIGLLESAILVGRSLGWKFDTLDAKLEPRIASHPIRKGQLRVDLGQVAGIHQVVTGLRGGQLLLTLELVMSVDVDRTYDRIIIEGRPKLDAYLDGGIAGDIATSAITVNAIARVVDAPPGLLTLADVPLVCAVGAVH